MAQDSAKSAATVCDPVTLQIGRGALRAIQGEMEAVIERTAMSPFIREKKDFYAALFDGAGRLIVGSNLPLSGDVVGPIVEHYALPTMRPGDIYWFNDCYASKGAVSHSPDQVFVAPVFAEGKLAAFAQSWAHFNDIGGMRAGSLSPDCTEIFQEGIIVPPVRVARESVISDELLRLFFRNSRFPEMVKGDTSASDDQVPGPVNSLMSPQVPSMVFGSYLLAEGSDSILNAGVEKAIDEVIVRPGSVLQPKFPAPLGMRGVTMMRNMAACLGLLNVAAGGKAMAAHSAYVIWYLRGRKDDGELFLLSDGLAVGYGARPTSDGNDAVYLVAQENFPSEFLDSVFPVRVRSYAINPDTGGPGRWRGGCGLIREVEVLAPEAMVSMRIDTVENPPWGVAGGHAAGSGRCVVNPGRSDERVLKPLSDGNIVFRGDVVRVETGGGGGWGHPFDREPERVLADVQTGFVSRAKAEEDYGVV